MGSGFRTRSTRRVGGRVRRAVEAGGAGGGGGGGGGGEAGGGGGGGRGGGRGRVGGGGGGVGWGGWVWGGGGGGGSVSLDPRTATTGPTVVMLTRGAEPPREIAGIHGDTQGIRAITASIRKTPTASLESRVKANNYLNGILARWEAIDAGVDE